MATTSSSSDQPGGGSSDQQGKKGAAAFSEVVRRIDNETTPLVREDSIDSWGLRGHYDMPPSKPDAGWCVRGRLGKGL